MDSTVEERLNFVMHEICAGASPWRIKEKDLDQLRDHYRPGFEKSKNDWPIYEVKVLRLARYQGALAALLAEAEVPKGPAPDWIKTIWLWLASFLVQIVCPEKRGETMMGDPCPYLPLDRLDLAAVQRVLAWISKIAHAEDRQRLKAALKFE